MFENVVESGAGGGGGEDVSGSFARLMGLMAYMDSEVENQHKRDSSSLRSGAAPEPEGPGQVRERFEALNRPRPWDVSAQAGSLLGKLDLKSGAAVVAIAEVLNAAVGDSIAGALGLPYPGWIVAFVLPALSGFVHRKEKGKESAADPGGTPAPRIPQEMAAAVAESRRSHWRKGLDRVRDTLGG